MKQKRWLSALLAAALLLSVFTVPVLGTEEAEPERLGIGGGGSFFLPTVNPADPDNFLVTCDMGGLYHSEDAGRSWERTETRFRLEALAAAEDGTVFCGAYGLYAGSDGGATLERIYPLEVRHSVSRCGWQEELMLAEGYNNGYVKCISVRGNTVWFLTLDWSGEMRLLSCAYDGSGLTEYFRCQREYGRDPMSGVSCRMSAEDGFILYTFGNTLLRYDLTSGTEETVRTAAGTLNGFKKLGNGWVLLDTVGNRTAILYSADLNTWTDLSVYNTLDPTCRRSAYDWIFTDICGSGPDSFFVCFNSDAGSGVLRFDGTAFRYVLDKVNRTREEYGVGGWSYGGIGKVYGICAFPGDDSRCLVSTVETVYELTYINEESRGARSLHCVAEPDGSFRSTGLDVQTTNGVYRDPFDPEHLIITSHDLGLQISFNGGESWIRCPNPEYRDIQNTCYGLYFDRETEGRVYGIWSNRHDAPYEGRLSDRGWTEGAFAVSLDGGLSWDFDSLGSGLPADAIPAKMAVREDGDELTIAVACFNCGFWLSEDSGRTFRSLNGAMEDYRGFIWGADVLFAGDTLYCLTARQAEWGVPARLYACDLSTGVGTELDLGEIVIPRSLTADEEGGLYLNVVPYYRYQWIPEWGDGCHFNYGGGVYRYENGSFDLIFGDDYGVSGSAFAPDGTLYIATLGGEVYAYRDGGAERFAAGLFPNLKYVGPIDADTLYVSTQGGGVYRLSLPGGGPELPDEPGEEPEHTHTPELRNAREASCAAEGYTGDTVCAVCGELLSAGSAIPRLAHAPELRNAREASCAAEGYTGDTVCAVCGELLGTGSAIPKLAHAPGAPVCGGDGTHDIFCTVCGERISREDCGDADRDGACDRCGGEMPELTDLVRRSGFEEGKSYLILLSERGLGAALTAETLELETVSGGYRLRGELRPELLWTVSGGRLSCELDGTVYYLSAAASGKNAGLTLTESRSGASVWRLSGGRLSTTVAVQNGKKTKNTEFYLYASGGSAALSSSKKAGIVICEPVQ